MTAIGRRQLRNAGRETGMAHLQRRAKMTGGVAAWRAGFEETMFSPMIHIRLSRMTDQAKHRDENELFQLYHQPELRSLPEIAWVDRFANAPDCARHATHDAAHALDYAAISWLRPDAHASARALTEHFERAAQLGLHSRGWAKPVVDGFFVPLKGYVRKDALLSADALPFRPNTGAYLLLTEFFRHHDVEAEDVFRWYDQTRIPQLLDCAGAAGAWTFGAREFYTPTRDLAQPIQRLTIVYLQGDPLAFANDVAASSKEMRDTTMVERLLFAGPLRAIVPWQWGWFDARGVA